MPCRCRTVLLKRLTGLNLNQKSSWFLIRTAEVLQPPLPVDPLESRRCRLVWIILVGWIPKSWGQRGEGDRVCIAPTVLVSKLHLDQAAKTCAHTRFSSDRPDHERKGPVWMPEESRQTHRLRVPSPSGLAEEQECSFIHLLVHVIEGYWHQKSARAFIILSRCLWCSPCCKHLIFVFMTQKYRYVIIQLVSLLTSHIPVDKKCFW